MTERERVLAEEIRKDTSFVTQESGHLGCHDRSKVKTQDELKEKFSVRKKMQTKQRRAFKNLRRKLPISRTSGI